MFLDKVLGRLYHWSLRIYSDKAQSYLFLCHLYFCFHKAREKGQINGDTEFIADALDLPRLLLFFDCGCLFSIDYWFISPFSYTCRFSLFYFRCHLSWRRFCRALGIDYRYYQLLYALHCTGHDKKSGCLLPFNRKFLSLFSDWARLIYLFRFLRFMSHDLTSLKG